MGFPAARVTDMHVCPLVTGVVPHVGGPILPPGGLPTLIGSLPASRMGHMATCVGPPDLIDEETVELCAAPQGRQERLRLLPVEVTPVHEQGEELEVVVGAHRVGSAPVAGDPASP